ncbi:class III lanthipeptide [Streptomyces sp. NPDC060028]
MAVLKLQNLQPRRTPGSVAVASMTSSAWNCCNKPPDP